MPQINQAGAIATPHNAIIKTIGRYTFHAIGHHSQRDYIGFEIEVDGRNVDSSMQRLHQAICTNILTAGGLASHCTHDGSLRNGFELITHPATLDYLKAIEPTLYKLWKFLTENGYNNDLESAGGHIHVAKRTLGKTLARQDENIERLIKWVYRNREQFITYCERESRYARYIDYRDDDSKYVAVNTAHTKTIEFRMFNGLTSLANMLANAELVTLIIKTLTNYGSKHLEDYTLETLILANARSHKNAYNHWLAVKG